MVEKGIDKAYGIQQLCKRLGISESDSLYVGDEIQAGGNDEAVYKTELPSYFFTENNEKILESVIPMLEGSQDNP